MSRGANHKPGPVANFFASIIIVFEMILPLVFIGILSYSAYGEISDAITGKDLHTPIWKHERTYYYVPNGACYHKSKQCPTLHDSDTIIPAKEEEIPSWLKPCGQCNPKIIN